MADVRWPRRRTLVVSCGVMVVVSLSFSLFLLSVLSESATDDSPEPLVRRTVKLRPDRSILDVHYTNINSEKEVKEHIPVDVNIANDVTNSPSSSSSSSSSPPSPHSTELHHTTEQYHTKTPSDCKGPWPGYPQCGDKMAWMQDHWKSDECYTQHGVNGSLCSIQIYLSEVESFCPRLPERENFKEPLSNQLTLQYKVDGLLDKLHGNQKFDWISHRIQRLWPEWSEALATLQAKQPFTHSSGNVLVHIGALSDKAGFHFAENAGKGGPLGELVQWSDLIASLYALGYNIDFSTETTQLNNFLVVNYKGGCPSASETKYVAVFLDIVGLKQLRKATKNRFMMYRCLLRVLDTFGTEPVFNYKKWKPERDGRGHDYGHTWGNWELNPRQFMTMYPHTPDNSFLGFVVEKHNVSHTVPSHYANKSLVYGKELYMWKNKKDYLQVIAKYFDVYATIGTTQNKGEVLDWSVVPSFVHNQGILGGPQLQQLLQQSRVFVGLGFPYEGPAPLEAVAQGCIFLNPKVTPPIDRTNSKFFERKPTNRKIDSQNPYMDMFIGKPYVYTFDASNLTKVESVIQEILKQPRPPPYIPYEFTFEGMLERITAYLKNQQYCRPNQWPPADMLITTISKDGQSCKDTCFNQGLVCEPELFPLLNTEKAFSNNGIECITVRRGPSVHGPSLTLSDSHCSLQVDNLLLSCAGSKSGVQRLCPCRKYRKGQVALCLSCSR